MKRKKARMTKKKKQNMNRRDKKTILYFFYSIISFWKEHEFWHLNMYKTARQRLTMLAELLI